MKEPLLVIAHEATRTGAPRVLLDLLTSIRGQIPAPMAIRVLAEGPLAGDLRELADVTDLGARPAAVVINGAAAAGALQSIEAGVPSLVYVHEEGEAIGALPPSCTTALTDRANRLLCVSARSSHDLERIGVSASRIQILPPAVPARTQVASYDASRALEQLGFDTTRPLVIGCGEAGWRKGADLFVDVARRVVAQRSAQFGWAGRRPRSFARLLDNDTNAAGLSGELRWLGELADIQPLFGAAEVLVMPSREDPQPLVPLEAAASGTATVGFGIGGIHDLAVVGAAAAVEFPDTVALAQEVVSLLDEPDRRVSLSSAAESRRCQHHSVEVVGARFLSEVCDLLEDRIR